HQNRTIKDMLEEDDIMVVEVLKKFEHFIWVCCQTLALKGRCYKFEQKMKIFIEPNKILYSENVEGLKREEENFLEGQVPCWKIETAREINVAHIIMNNIGDRSHGPQHVEIKESIRVSKAMGDKP
ncbi:hypothetical protein ACJX0J_022492, partial [Zea mays]